MKHFHAFALPIRPPGLHWLVIALFLVLSYRLTWRFMDIFLFNMDRICESLREISDNLSGTIQVSPR